VIEAPGRVAVLGLALAGFLAFAGRDPLVAFHAGFDRELIERACDSILHMKPQNPWLDLALLGPALYADRSESAHALDDWLHIFGIENYARHDALADALATAQLLLAVLAAARQRRLATWADLVELQQDQRSLAAIRRFV